MNCEYFAPFVRSARHGIPEGIARIGKSLYFQRFYSVRTSRAAKISGGHRFIKGLVVPRLEYL